MTQPRAGAAPFRPSRAVNLLALTLPAMTGCATQTAPRIRLQLQVQLPPRCVVLVTVDGLAVSRLDELLTAGDLPNIRRIFIDGGVRVRRAIATQPTITYANLTTILTGRAPARHGILGNKWFDRYALLYRDYTTTGTYRLTDGEFLAPTLFERLNDQTSASVQCAIRRGATRPIDNWATSGIRWFFGFLENIDWLSAERLALIAEDANQRGRWPALIHFYMPAVDEIGHRHGCESAAYRHALVNIDAQIGRIHAALATAGLADRTYFVLTSDHGHVPVPPDRYFDVEGWLRQELGRRENAQSAGWHGQGTAVSCRGHVASRGGQVALRVISHPPGGPNAAPTFEERRRIYGDCDAVVVINGDRVAAIHLRGPGYWWQPADQQRLSALLNEAPPPIGNPAAAGRLQSEIGDSVTLWNSAAVALAAAPEPEGDSVNVYSSRGRSRIRRRRIGPSDEYRYDPLDADALGDWMDDRCRQAVESGWHDERTWLAATADTRHPGLIAALGALFDSPRAGDLVLFAAPEWDFVAGNRGGHGGIFRDEVLVPMLFAGPDLPHGAEIDLASLADVAPTILDLLAAPGDPNGRTFDGIDLAPALRVARNPRDAHSP